MRTVVLGMVLSAGLAFAAGESAAQVVNPRLAAPGPAGIFIEAGNEIPVAMPVAGGSAGYRLERKGDGEQQWHEVALLRAPASKEEFISRLELSARAVPVPFSASQLPVDKIWARAARHNRVDSLGIWGGLLAVRLALGVAAYDTSARSGSVYQYRVNRVDPSGKTTGTMLSDRVSYPFSAKLAEMRCVQRFGGETDISLRWLIGTGKRPAFVDVYRRKGFAGEFEKLGAVVTVKFERQAASFVVRDTLVVARDIYQYYLRPFDSYGNAAGPSDTALVAAIEFSRIQPPQQLRAVSLDSAGGIAVRWIIPDPSYLRSVRIYRSELWDSGYVQIGEVTANAHEYIDQAVEPMKDYFYYMRWTGALGEESPPSVRVRSEYRQASGPLPPAGVFAESDAKGVRLHWAHVDADIRGYYVYRSGAAADQFIQVSPLVRPRGEGATFLDSSGMVGALTYAYVVRSENASHRLGHASDTVYARPGFATAPPAPSGLKAHVDDRVAQLSWDNMYQGDPTLQGTMVFRREAPPAGKSRDFVSLTDTPLPPQQNYYSDPTLKPGVVYQYVVRSIDVTGNKSEQSRVVAATIPFAAVLPPAGVRAARQQKGILVEWDEGAEDDVAAFRIYRYERGKSPSRLGEVKADSQMFLDTKASKGRLYFYYVTAVSGKRGEGPASSEVGIRP